MMYKKRKKPRTPLLVYTDLDGTLLDHDSYSFEAALPALRGLESEALLHQVGRGHWFEPRIARQLNQSVRNHASSLILVSNPLLPNNSFLQIAHRARTLHVTSPRDS